MTKNHALLSRFYIRGMKYWRNILHWKQILGKKLHVTGRNFLSKEQISCDRKKFPAKCYILYSPYLGYEISRWEAWIVKDTDMFVFDPIDLTEQKEGYFLMSGENMISANKHSCCGQFSPRSTLPTIAYLVSNIKDGNKCWEFLLKQAAWLTLAGGVTILVFIILYQVEGGNYQIWGTLCLIKYNKLLQSTCFVD